MCMNTKYQYKLDTEDWKETQGNLTNEKISVIDSKKNHS